MIICVKCEYENDDNALFCQQCGSRITYSNQVKANDTVTTPEVFNKQPVNQSFNPNNLEYKQPVVFTIFLLFNYLIVGILGLFSVLFVAYPLICIIFLVLAGLFFWFVSSLQHYNNTARVVYLVLDIIGLILSLISGNFIVLPLGLAMFYVLRFHESTLDLFHEVRKQNKNRIKNHTLNSSLDNEIDYEVTRATLRREFFG